MKGLVMYRDSSVRKYLKEYFPEFEFADNLPADSIEDWDTIIRWNNSQGEDNAKIILNRKQALQNTSSQIRTLSILKLNGLVCQRTIRRGSNGLTVATNVSSERIRRRYRAYVFDLEVLAIYRKMGRTYRRISTEVTDEVIEKIKSFATRTTYHLGLHVAVVEIGLITETRPVVISVSPEPKLTRGLASVYASAIRTHLSKQGLLSAEDVLPMNTGEIVLGADPEFMLRNRFTGRMIPASRLFPRSGPIGCDNRVIRGQVKHYPLAEVRPQPSPNPIELVKNIRLCLRRGIRLATAKEIRSIKWEAGSMPFKGFPIGGHVHFSNVELSSDLLRALDNYVAIPTMLIERNSTAIERRRKYGHLGDHRVKEHGGFEYRTLGSWLMSPKIATAVICLAKLVATEYRVLSSDYLNSFSAQKSFYRGEKAFFQSIFQSLWIDIASTPTYATYANELSILKDLVEENKRWKETVDIKKTWNLM